MECDTPLKSSQQELQICFRPHPHPRSKQKVMNSQSPESPNWGTKSHSDVGAAEQCRKYYMGEGGGFPRVWAVVSLVNPKLPVACPSTKGVLKCELTNLLVGLMQVRVSN